MGASVGRGPSELGEAMIRALLPLAYLWVLVLVLVVDVPRHVRSEVCR